MNNEFKEHIINSLNKGIRLDGRKKEDFRKIGIETGIIKTAEGSAKVKFGDTELIAGVKLSIDKPYPDIPEEGVLMTGTESLPLSNPEFETGPPSIEVIEVARVIDRGIRESKTMDMKKLCIEKGEKVWMVSVDICPINNNGNLIDIGAVAALAALKDTKFPECKDNVIDYKKSTNKSLELKKSPLAITVMKIGKNFIIDPTEDEQKVMDARLTVTMTEDDKLCALQKGGDSPLTTEDISFMIDLASKKIKELRKMLNL